MPRLSNLQLRIVSALVLAVAVLWLTWAGGLAFRLLAAAICSAVYFEWALITRRKQTAISVALGWGVIGVVDVLMVFGIGVGTTVLVLCVGAAALTTVSWQRSRLWAGGGVVYSAFPAIALAQSRGIGAEGLYSILFLFAVVWATDIFAYFAGRKFGGAKLAPRISPNKTWSGAIGGAAAAFVASVAFIVVLKPAGGAALALIALAMSVTAQLGDLGESWIKREFGVKDSSHLIPGHGGVMDRVDGLVAAATLMYLISTALTGLEAPSVALFAM